MGERPGSAAKRPRRQRRCGAGQRRTVIHAGGIALQGALVSMAGKHRQPGQLPWKVKQSAARAALNAAAPLSLWMPGRDCSLQRRRTVAQSSASFVPKALVWHGRLAPLFSRRSWQVAQGFYTGLCRPTGQTSLHRVCSTQRMQALWNGLHPYQYPRAAAANRGCGARTQQIWIMHA